MNYQYVRLSDALMPDVRFLFRESFGKRVTTEYLIQKYATDHVGVKHLAFLAYEGKKPVAFYGGVPQLFTHKGLKHRVVHACDSFTLPSHHRRGLHTNLALRSYDLMRENNVKFVYAMHSLNTLRATKKLGWMVGDSMLRYHVRISTLPVSKVVNRLKFLTYRYQELVRQNFGSFSSKHSLNNPLENEEWLCHEYSPSFFDYKNYSLIHKVRINEVDMWLKVQSIIHIGAFHAPSVDDLERALKVLIRIGNKIGANEIQFHVSQGSQQNFQLSQLYSGLESWTVGYLDLDSNLPFEKFKLNYGDHDTF